MQRGIGLYRALFRWGLPCGAILWALIFWCGSVFAADYYVKNGGDNSNTGLSDAQAWATIAKVEASTFAAGDTIYFNRGDTWIGNQLAFPSSGESGNVITLDAYGTGAKPILYSAFALYSSKSYVTVKNLEIHTTATKYGIQLEGVNNVIIEDCIIDGDNQDFNCINVDYFVTTGVGSSDVIIRNNTVRDGGVRESDDQGGINVGRSSTSIIVEDNTVIDCEEFGIQAFGLTADYSVTDVIIRNNTITNSSTSTGRGINVGWADSDVIVERNYVEGNAEGIAVDSAITGINVIRNNVVYNALELLTVRANVYGNSDNSVIVNNTFIAGPATVKGVKYVTSSGATGTGHIFKNNIITSTKSFWPNLIIEDGMTVDSDYNCFYNAGLTNEAYFSTEYTITDYVTLASWQAATSQDANSIAQDPLFITDNYSLQLTSPCNDTGVTLTDVTRDYFGFNRPRGSAYDIGAIEYGGGISWRGEITIE